MKVRTVPASGNDQPDRGSTNCAFQLTRAPRHVPTTRPATIPVQFWSICEPLIVRDLHYNTFIIQDPTPSDQIPDFPPPPGLSTRIPTAPPTLFKHRHAVGRKYGAGGYVVCVYV